MTYIVVYGRLSRWFGDRDLLASLVTRELDLIRSTGPVTFTGSDISFGLCFKLDLMSWDLGALAVSLSAQCQCGSSGSGYGSYY